MIYCDTRQKDGKHFNISQWFDEHGVEYAVKKLDYGDYFNPENPSVVVDTKRSLDELCSNVCTGDHARFKREMERASEAGARLIVLVEEHPEYNDRRPLMGGWLCYKCRHCTKCNALISPRCYRTKSGRKPANGLQLMRALNTIEGRYPVEFCFCLREDTARILCELLEVSVND